VAISLDDGAIGLGSLEDGAIGLISDDDDEDDDGAADEDDGAGATLDELTGAALELEVVTTVVVEPPRLKMRMRPMITITATMMIIQVLRFMGFALGWRRVDLGEVSVCLTLSPLPFQRSAFLIRHWRR
jgi:hypothetical protein